jgi:hypothetical protein
MCEDNGYDAITELVSLDIRVGAKAPPYIFKMRVELYSIYLREIITCCGEAGS